MATLSKRILIPISVTALTLSVAAPVGAGTDAPGGNNGTVKVSGRDVDSIPDNQPHQSCVFNVEFFGYDRGALEATATFEVIRSTGDVVVFKDTHIFIGEDAASGESKH